MAFSSPMQFELSVRGTAQIENELAAKHKGFIRKLQKIVKNYGEATRELTAFLSPYRTGYMSSKVRTFYRSDRLVFETGWSADDFLGKGFQFYPFYQEFGTVNHAAQPSLTPAFREMAPLFQRDIAMASREFATEHF